MLRLVSPILYATLALSSSLSLAATKSDPLTTFGEDLCGQVASSGDENGTDSTEAYAVSCRNDLEAKHLTSAAAIVKAICPVVSDYSADLNETLDDTKTPAEVKSLEQSLIKECYRNAADLAGKAGLDL